MNFTIKAIEPTDLPDLQPMAEKFAAESGCFPGFQMQLFSCFWTMLLESKKGVIFYLYADETLAGTLGALAFTEPYTGRETALEFFVYVAEPFRASGAGKMLFDTYERWAKEMGCQEIRLGHLENSMPEMLKGFYGKMGYTAMETNYRKEIG